MNPVVLVIAGSIGLFMIFLIKYFRYDQYDPVDTKRIRDDK